MSPVAIQLNKEKISILFSLHGITEQYPSFYIPFLFLLILLLIIIIMEEQT
jgi:hypothetical protein